VSHVIVKFFGKDSAPERAEGNCGASPQFMMYRRAYPESKMLKSKRGEAAYWLVGAAGVVVATWQFAVLVTN
jgi:hypothetical protein